MKRGLRPVLLVVCTLLMLLTGELAGVIGFRFLGYAYLPPNVLTRALPYMLLGGLLREKADALRKVKKRVWLLLIPIGLALAFGEFTLLGRLGLLATTSHAVGLGLNAFSICTWALYYTHMKPNFFCLTGRLFSKVIYAASQPIAFLMIVPMSVFFPSVAAFIQFLGGLIVYPVCLGLAVLMDMTIFINKA